MRRLVDADDDGVADVAAIVVGSAAFAAVAVAPVAVVIALMRLLLFNSYVSY